MTVSVVEGAAGARGERGDSGAAGPPGLPGEKGARGKRGKRVTTDSYMLHECTSLSPLGTPHAARPTDPMKNNILAYNLTNPCEDAANLAVHFFSSIHLAADYRMWHDSHASNIE